MFDVLPLGDGNPAPIYQWSQNINNQVHLHTVEKGSFSNSPNPAKLRFSSRTLRPYYSLNISLYCTYTTACLI